MQFQKGNMERKQRKDRQRPVYVHDDSEYGEMIYTDPNGNQILSPMVESQEQIIDQNDPQKGRSVFQTVRNDLRNNSDMVQLVADQPIPSLVVNIPSRNLEDQYERSPKINIGSSRDEIDDNIRPINARKSPKNMIIQNYRDSNDDIVDQGPYDDEDMQPYGNATGESQQRIDPRSMMYSRSRSPQVSQIYRNKNLSPYGKRVGAGGVVPFNKMSPSQNYYEDLNSSGEKNQDPTQYNNLKNYLGNSRTLTRPERYMNPSINQTVRNPIMTNQRDDVGSKYNNRTYNNMSYRDIKKLANRFTKIYDPNRNSNGILVEESQITVPGASDEVFNNRYRVLSKMNRLSNILLAKQRRSPPRYEENYTGKTYPKERERERERDRDRDNSYSGDTKKTFGGRTMQQPSVERKRRAYSRSPDHKFLYVSLAMISSKGPTCEDRTILRRMRLEKGGVVDLAQEDIKKNKFKIQKAKPKKGGARGYANPKYREKAARTIQNWWRDLKNLYNDRLAKIIKIQSVWRGKFVRKYMYDLFYLNFLYISFCKKIENVLSNHVRPYVWEKLFNQPEEEVKDPERERRLRHLVNRDYRNDLASIRPAWRKWLSMVRKLNNKNAKGRNLVQIRADKENKLGDLRICFNKWVYIKKILNAEDKLNEKEIEPENKEDNLNKIKGLFKVLEGIDKITKKDAMNQVVPKIEDYMKDQAEQNRLRNLLNKKPEHDRKLLRKYLYKWYHKALQDRDDEDLDERNRRLDELRARVFKNILDKIRNKQNKNIMRKYFYKYFKKVVRLIIKDEKDKNKDKDRLYSQKEVEIIEEYEKRIEIINDDNKIKEEDWRKKIRDALDKLKKEQKEKEDALKAQLESSKNEDLLKYLQGAEILQRYCWRRTHEDPLNAFGEKVDLIDLIDKLKRLLKIKKASDKSLLREAFNRWKRNALKRVNKDLLSQLFAKLLEITSNDFKRKLLAKKFHQWRRNAGINPYDSLKKAKEIYDLADLIRRLYVNKYGDEFLDRLDKTRNPGIYRKPLRNILNKLSKRQLDALRKAFNKWRNLVKDEDLQKLKSKLLMKLYEKKFGLRKYLLRKYFDKWKNAINDDYITKIREDITIISIRQSETRRKFIRQLLKGLDNKTKEDLLRKYFNIWKRKVQEMRDRDRLREKLTLLLRKYVSKKEQNDLINLLHYFLRWKNKVAEMKAKEAHKPYRKKVISILMTKNDKEELQRVFTKWKYGGLKKMPIMPYIVAKRIMKKAICRRPFREFVDKMTERDPRVLRRKGRPMEDALNDIKRRHMREFLDRLKLYIRCKKLAEVQPKVHEKLKKYYLRKYFDRWVDNTLGDKERKKEALSAWLKRKYEEDRIERERRLKELLRNYIRRANRNRKLLLMNAIRKLHKNTKLDIQEENDKTIQNFCREVVQKVILEKIAHRKKLVAYLVKLYNREYIRRLIDFGKNDMPEIADELRRRRRRIEMIRRILRATRRRNDRDLLRKYFNKWRDTKGLYTKMAIIIQKKIRQLLAKNKAEGIRRLYRILMKLYLLHVNDGKDLLRSALHKWRADARMIECEENSCIIQDFCRKHLNDYLRNKLKNLLERLAKKYVARLINNNAKVNDLNKKLRKKPLKDAFDAIKRAALLNDIKKALLRLLLRKGDKYRELLLRYYLNKWRDIVDRLNNKNRDAATTIQKVFRGYLVRKNIGREQYKITILKIILLKIYRYAEPRDILNSALQKWAKITRKDQCHENGNIAQDFCRGILDKIRKEKYLKMKDAYQKLARAISKVTVSPEEFMERLKLIRRLQILKELMDKINKKRLDNLRYAFNKIREFPRKKYLLRCQHIPDDLRKRLLRKYLYEWRDRAMRKKILMEILRIIFKNYEDNNKNVLRATLKKWLCHAHFLTQLEQEEIISEFCKPILKKINALRNWKKLANGLRNKHIGEDKDEIIKRLRYWLGLKKLKKPIKQHAQRDVIDALKNNNLYRLFRIRIKKIIEMLYDDSKYNLLNKYFHRWKEIANKLRDREDASKDIVDILDKLHKKKATPNITDASILKKFLHDYPKIRALGFLRKLHDFYDEKNKNDNLAKDLIRARKDIAPQNRNNLLKKLFKVYAYKVLSKFFDNLEELQRAKARPIMEEFLNLLYNNLIKNAERSYSDRKENETLPKNKKTSFRLKKPVRAVDDRSKKLTYVTLVPSLVKYLNDKILRRKREAFDNLKKDKNANKFCQLYRSWADKQLLPPKRELVDLLKGIYYKEVSRLPLLLKLFKLLRHGAIHRMLRHSRKVRKVHGMMYVIRLYIMSKHVAKERFLRQLIRRWRYVVFSKKLATNKMKTIYKNLHMTYLEMANCLFGDDATREPSVIKEFERFGTSVGMWENEKPEDRGEEKFCKVIKTKYVFDDKGFEKYESTYYPEEVYEEEDVKEGEYKTKEAEEVSKAAMKSYMDDLKKGK